MLLGVFSNTSVPENCRVGMLRPCLNKYQATISGTSTSRYKNPGFANSIFENIIYQYVVQHSYLAEPVPALLHARVWFPSQIQRSCRGFARCPQAGAVLWQTSPGRQAPGSGSVFPWK